LAQEKAQKITEIVNKKVLDAEAKIKEAEAAIQAKIKEAEAAIQAEIKEAEAAIQAEIERQKEAEREFMEAQQQIKDAELADIANLEATKDRILSICEEEGFFCGMILTKEDILSIVSLAIDNKDNIKIPFVLYFNKE